MATLSSWMYVPGLRGVTWDAIRDPIYDYIEYNKEVEAGVLDTRVVQRLRRIRQLQLSHLVYPGADHTRFQHSLGVMHLAGMFSSHLVSEITRLLGEEGLRGHDPGSLVEAARIAGLLHDVGHGPFSHAFEDAVLSGSRELAAKGVGNHEDIGLRLVEYTGLSDVIRGAEEQYGLPGLAEYVSTILGEAEPSDPVLRAVRKTVKAWLYPSDIMDFLMRDSYYTGTREYGVIDYVRLIRNTRPYPEEGRQDKLLLERKALGALRSYLYSRTSMYEHVYFHPVSMAFTRLLVEVLRAADEHLGLTEAVEKLGEGDPDEYLRLDDWWVTVKLGELASQASGELSDKIRMLLERRNPWKRIGRDYKIPLVSRGEGSEPLILALRYHSKWVRDLEEELRRRALEIMGDDAEDIWIASSTLYPAPLSSLVEPRPLIEAKFIRDELVEASELNIYEFMVREGIVPSIIVRAYAPRRALKDRAILSRLGSLFHETVSSFFSLGSYAGGITL